MYFDIIPPKPRNQMTLGELIDAYIDNQRLILTRLLGKRIEVLDLDTPSDPRTAPTTRFKSILVKYTGLNNDST